jgi:hypothetical protein
MIASVLLLDTVLVGNSLISSWPNENVFLGAILENKLRWSGMCLHLLKLRISKGTILLSFPRLNFNAGSGFAFSSPYAGCRNARSFFQLAASCTGLKYPPAQYAEF